MAAIDDLLRHVARRGASALHLADGRPPRVRHQGTLEGMEESGALADVGKLVEAITPPRIWADFERTSAVDFSYELAETGTFQVHLFRREGGLSAVLRRSPRAATLQERGLPVALKNLTRLRGGLVLAMGPIDSGKSTTLHAMIREIDTRLTAHVVTVEDPVELELPANQIALSQRQVGLHTESIASGIAEAIDMGADVIYASRLPDAASADLALCAADDGALVLSSMVANGVVGGLERFVELFDRERRPAIWRRLAHALRGATSQVLLPSLDAATGAGRIAAVEVVPNGRGIAPAIREGDLDAIFAQMDRIDAIQTLDDALVELVRARRIRPEDAHDHARDKRRIARALPSQG